MGEAITGVSFGTQPIRSDPDYLFKNVSVGAASGPGTRIDKLFGNVQGALEIVVEATSDLVIGANALTLVVNRAATDGGAVTPVKTLGTFVSTTVAKGTILGRFIPGPMDSGFYSVAFTSNAANTGTVSAFPHQVER